MVATHQDNMSHYSSNNNNNSVLDLDDVQTPARYIATFSFFAFDLSYCTARKNCLKEQIGKCFCVPTARTFAIVPRKPTPGGNGSHFRIQMDRIHWTPVP